MNAVHIFSAVLLGCLAYIYTVRFHCRRKNIELWTVGGWSTL